jgi:hypothetical protein
MGMLNWLNQWLQEDRAERYATPGVAVYYWGGGVPRAHPVRDISLTGAYLQDPDQWLAGTVISSTFRGTAKTAAVAEGTAVLVISFRVVRHGPDGIGVNFMPKTREEQLSLRQFVEQVSGTTGPVSGRDQPG